ncbi:MAG: GntR family transcriptional regulator [Pseudomonadota bacterium]
MTRSRRELQFVGPLYEQVADELEKLIVLGEFDRQHQLPAEVDLAGKFGVSSGTMRKALEQLVKSGLIRRQRGRGTVLNRRPPGHDRIQHFLDFSKIGLEIQPIVFTPSPTKTRTPSSQEAELLGLDESATILENQGSWSGPEGSRAIETILLPHRQTSDASGGVHGVDPSENWRPSQSIKLVVQSEATLKPAIASDDLADEIGIESGQPVLCFTSLTRDLKNVPVEYVRVWLYLNDAEYAYRASACADAQLKTY